MTGSKTDDTLAPELRELIERRSSLQQWLAGLDNQRGVAPERILNRVREDYEARLAATNAELSEHVAGVQAEMERAIEQTDAAERVHYAAVDALEEARLRHAIGELPGEGWADRERQLMEAVQAAKLAEDDSRIAADRLRDLLATLTQERPSVSDLAVARRPDESRDPAVVTEEVDAEAPAEAHSDHQVEAASDEAGEDSRAENSPALISVDSDPTVESGSAPVADEGEVFLEQVAVAVGAEVPSEAPGLFDEAELPSAEKKPPPGLKCTECGYTNDLSAWFCGVCGADVG